MDGIAPWQVDSFLLAMHNIATAIGVIAFVLALMLTGCAHAPIPEPMSKASFEIPGHCDPDYCNLGKPVSWESWEVPERIAVVQAN